MLGSQWPRWFKTGWRKKSVGVVCGGAGDSSSSFFSSLWCPTSQPCPHFFAPPSAQPTRAYVGDDDTDGVSQPGKFVVGFFVT